MKRIIFMMSLTTFASVYGQQHTMHKLSGLQDLNTFSTIKGNIFYNKNLNIQPISLNFFKEVNKNPLFPKLLSDMDLNTQNLQQKQQKLIPNEQDFFVEIQNLKNSR